MSTACVIVIGNEILAGKFPDENTPYLVRRLRELGLGLIRAVVIPDDLDEIAREIRYARDRAEVIITTGGVGPTHDDITMEGVARAYGVPLVERPELVALMRARMGPLNRAALRMARLPEGARLVPDPSLRFPLVVMDRVYILPGVPSLMRRKFEAAAAGWDAGPNHSTSVRTGERETAIAERLERAVARWPGVRIGSYPRGEGGARYVLVSIDGPEAAEVEACRAWLAAQLSPPGGG